MAQLHKLTRHSCERGDLTVFEDILPGTLKQIFYITNVDEATRGGHRHNRAWQALVCLAGSVEVVVETGAYTLLTPDQCLVIEPGEGHLLTNFHPSTIVLVVSNEAYEASEYIESSRVTPHIRVVDKQVRYTGAPV